MFHEARTEPEDWPLMNFEETHLSLNVTLSSFLECVFYNNIMVSVFLLQ